MQTIRRDARPLGVVYTPREVTGPMVARALAPLLAGRTAAEIGALRICDPAIGEGAFLIEVVNAVAAALREAGVHAEDARAQAVRCVRGVDVDERAVAAARVALGGGFAEGQLQVADALALAWPAAFPDVFASGGFDAVVGNPPYVRQEHLGDHKLRLRSFASYDGAADLYVYFVELAHRLVRPGGRFCLITPNKWLTAAYGRALRVHLAAQGSVEGVVDLGRSALFADADAFPCIVWGTVGGAGDRDIAAARRPAGAAIELGDGAPHARARWQADPWHIDAPAESALIDRLEAKWPALGEVVPGAPARGLVTGCNRAFVIDRATRERLLADEPAAAAVIRPFLKGRDIRRWLPAEGERWVLVIDRATSLDELPATLAHLARFRDVLEPRPPGHGRDWPGRKPGTYRWYELQDPVGAQIRARTPRLLYQDIQTAPLCAVDLDGERVPDTTVWMLPTSDRYLLAVLGSPIYGWYARRRFPPALNGSVRPKLAYMRRLPIATPPADLRAHIEALVEQRLAVARDASAGDGAALDAAIDRAVHDAYELSAAELVQVIDS